MKIHVFCSFCGTMTLLMEHALQCHSRTLHSPEQGWVTLHSCPGTALSHPSWLQIPTWAMHKTGSMGRGRGHGMRCHCAERSVTPARGSGHAEGTCAASWSHITLPGRASTHRENFTRENYARFWPLKIWVSSFFREKGLPTGIFCELTAFQRSL